MTARLKHDFSPNLSIADTVRYANYAFNTSRRAELRIERPDRDHAARQHPGRARCAEQLGRADEPHRAARSHRPLHTGPLRHVLVTGIELARQTNGLDRYTNPFNAHNSWVPETPLLDPDPNEPLPASR